MMEQKIEGRPLPTLHTAACDMEAFAGDLDDIAMLLFALADRNGDHELNPRALRGVMLGVEKLRDQVNARAEEFLEANSLTK